ncbi:aldehyde dehydrogenase family protein, partial [Bacillus licheniformis]|nr:aldehyde dehydrogenase family protein [Bacillus licheniformis]
QGQVCTAGSRAYIHSKVFDGVIERVAKIAASLKIGPGMDPATQIGPLVSAKQRERVCGYIDSGFGEGARAAGGGRAIDGPGFFVEPTVLVDTTQAMRVVREEIFGPVLGVIRLKSLDEAMALIDAHEYGNGTCLFTRDGEAARYFGDNIQIGMVGINVPLPVPVAYHSFGGWKRSLFGDLHAYGPDAVRFYTKRKTITQRWPSAGVR